MHRRKLLSPAWLWLAWSVLSVADVATAAGKDADADSHAHQPRWVQRHYGSTDGLPVSSATSARIDADGFLWLATHDGLARFDGQRFDVHESMRFPAMSGNRVLSLHLDAQQRLFAHTAHGDWLQVRSGLIEPARLGDGDAFASTGERGAGPLESANAPAGDAGSPPPRVRHVDADSLCLTTALALHCPDGSGGFPARWRFPEGVEPGLALPAGAGQAWLVTRQRSIWLLRDGAWQRVRDADPQLPVQMPRHAVSTGDGSLWTEIGGRLLQVTAAGESRLWDDDDRHGDSPGDILQLRRGADGSVLAGAENGLFRIEHGRPLRLFAHQGPDAGYRSWDAPDGSFWVGHGGRLWRLPKPPPSPARVATAVRSGPVLPATQDPSPPARPLPAQLLPAHAVLTDAGDIQDLLVTPEGNIWVMTLRNGIHRLTRARVDLLDDIAGVRGGNVYGVSRDGDGTVWLGTLDSGLLAVRPDGSAQRFGAESGLP
ncbi:MAG: hypothetical protein WCZ02_11005, partial [Lysobacterales bacterium]